jgi:hypothetical protein
MHERREDPRTDPSRSLQNLLRMRARREAFDLAVVSTGDGVLMASSRQGSIAERAAAHASVKGQTSRWGDDEARTLVGRRLDVGGLAVLLAVVTRAPVPDDRAVNELAERVVAILSEHRARAAA